MIRRFRMSGVFAVLALALLAAPSARAEIVTGGTAEFIFNNNSPLFQGSSGPLTMNKFYGTGVDTETRDNIVAGVGGDSITVPGSGLVELDATLNGSSVLDPTGRDRQITNLDTDFSNVLATWGALEQVGVDAVLRTTTGLGPVVLGDFSLINIAGTLVLMNNFDASLDAFTIGTPVFTDLGNGFSVSGDLLVSSSLSFLTGVTAGTDVGSFSMVAVPEPSSLALLAASVLGAGMLLRRRRLAA